MYWFALAILLLTIQYAYLLGSAARGFVRVARTRGLSREQPRVSVIVPARDEEGTIGLCLDSILSNDYPADLLEVVVVDDGSTDRTAEVVRSFQHQAAGIEDPSEEPDVRLIRMDVDQPGLAHKKRALKTALAESTGEIVLTTDADCTVPATWIRTMVSYFDSEVGMVTGPVLYRREDSLFSRLQSLEFMGLVALGAGMVGTGKPHLCNSANLGYRRRAYDEVGGYEGLEGISTGDDEMLLHRIAYESTWRIRSCMEPEAAVETEANRTLREFFLQRKRWASAHARYPHVRLTITSILTYLFYLSLPAALLLTPPALFLVVLLVKIAAEASLMVPASRTFRRASLVPLLLPAQVLYIPYILIIGIAGTFGEYTWKGRRVR